ncbi:hypothetical protein [Staphylococcus haemolyticus]
MKDIDDVGSGLERMGENVKKGIIGWGDDDDVREVKGDVGIY